MQTIDQISSLIEQQISQITPNRSSHGLYHPIEYILEDGGKRMRPMLSILAFQLFGDLIERAIPSALAVEVFHNFTLLHDDIMDNASQRRGRSTVHVKWDANRAILSGDAMMILSYQILSQSDSSVLVALFCTFNKAALEVCEGQQLDMEFEDRQVVSLDEYLEMIRLKTAVLMAAALEMGAVAAGADKAQCAALYKFGENLGLAFQIQDDMLDTYGNSATFGKCIGGDIAEGKQTFLKITAINLCSDADRETLTSSRDYSTVRSIYDRVGVRVVAQKAIGDYFELARRYLDIFDIDRCAPLRQYADILLHRNK